MRLLGRLLIMDATLALLSTPAPASAAAYKAFAPESGWKGCEAVDTAIKAWAAQVDARGGVLIERYNSGPGLAIYSAVFIEASTGSDFTEISCNFGRVSRGTGHLDPNKLAGLLQRSSSLDGFFHHGQVMDGMLFQVRFRQADRTIGFGAYGLGDDKPASVKLKLVGEWLRLGADQFDR